MAEGGPESSIIASELNVHIKQELDKGSCCSPSPSTMQSATQSEKNFNKNCNVSFYYPHLLLIKCKLENNWPCDLSCCSSVQLEYKLQSSSVMGPTSSPGSPDRQFCSSTSGIGEISSDSVHQSTIKEELPRYTRLMFFREAAYWYLYLIKFQATVFSMWRCGLRISLRSGELRGVQSIF